MNTTDLLQILLSLPGWIGYAICVGLFSIVWLLYRYAKAILTALFSIFREIRRPFIPITRGSLVWLCLGGGLLFSAGAPLSDGIQHLEQRYLHPTYLQADTAQWVVDVYEQEMSRHLYPSEIEIVRQRTRQIAARVGSTPLAIYEVAYSECGLNPFCVRKDGIAAGWIQFTTAGLHGLGYTLSDVKAACQRRDTRFIMDLTEAYLISRAKGRALPRACDIYTCVFAPGWLGVADDVALYCTSHGAAYDLNAGLDGYYLCDQGGRQLIMQSRQARDGRITITDLRLCLESKKAGLLNNKLAK